MQAEPGGELACRARSYRFERHGKSQEQGVITYYAGQTLAQATTFAAWLQHIEKLSSAALQAGRLPSAFYQPSLQILGDTMTRLPGQPVAAVGEPR
jgi:hypothetical protein